ncbi:hypothetical protein KFE25_013627 [Diacronema lutheri]|uniref:Hexosyltransferase n=1 Tax=Diacronema lutheri TaxID=2081491 RepID=A0A8J5XYQ1_DIALT|nr:hypothetical protein KFE25_013627 [Diacronema lutheri]
MAHSRSRLALRLALLLHSASAPEPAAPIHVVCGCSLDQRLPMVVLLDSMLRHRRSSDGRLLHVHVFAAAEESAAWDALLGCVLRPTMPPSARLIVHTFNESAWEPSIVTRSVERGTQRLTSAYNWFRWYAHLTLGAHARKFVYLDCDTLVRADVAALADIELASSTYGRAAIGAVFTPQPLRAFLCQRTRTIQKWALVRPDRTRVPLLSDEVHALNAGVLVFDADEWARQRTLEVWHALQLRSRAGGCLWKIAGQPELQLIFGERIAQLDPRWNHGWLGSTAWLLRERGDAFVREWAHAAAAQAYVLHWNGPLKPWAARAGARRAGSEAAHANRTPATDDALVSALWWEAASNVRCALERCARSLGLRNTPCREA